MTTKLYESKTYHFTCSSCRARLQKQDESFSKPGMCQFCYEVSQNETVCVRCGYPAFKHRVERVSFHGINTLCPNKHSPEYSFGPGRFKEPQGVSS